MILLKTYLEELNKLVKENPEFLELPVVYCSDDEGNDLHKVIMYAAPLNVEDVSQYFLELTEGDLPANVIVLN